MKKISLFVFFVLTIYSFSESIAQEEIYSLSSLQKLNCEKTDFKKIVDCDSCLIRILDAIEKIKDSDLTEALHILNCFGSVSDASSSEIISSTLFSLYKDKRDEVIKSIYVDNLENLKSFILNELCLSIESQKEIKNKKEEIINDLKIAAQKKKYKKEYKKLIRDFKSFTCNM